MSTEPGSRAFILTAQIVAENLLAAIRTVCPEHYAAIEAEALGLLRAQVDEHHAAMRQNPPLVPRGPGRPRQEPR